MPYLSVSRILINTFESLDIPSSRIKRIVSDFRAEMSRGLCAQKSSLKMIPTYVDAPSGKEKGRFIALDLGGTNLRILELELAGNARIRSSFEKRFTLENKYTSGRQEDFFDFICECIQKFAEESKISLKAGLSLGFTFSFPIRQTGVSSGILLRWTKDFSVKGVEGKEVVGLLRKSLIKKGLNYIKIAALVNDTVGTLVARSYSDPDCDIGVILGTGTNACYRERISQIAKLKHNTLKTTNMIINIEWGNFNKLKLAPFDAELDKASVNPGEQILEKMVSGMYLGEIARIIIRDLAKEKILFGAADTTALNRRGVFVTRYLSDIEADSSNGLLKTQRLLRGLGIRNSTLRDRVLVKKICELVSRRGARLSAIVLAAVITKIDSRLLRKHTIAIDGTLYEKHPGYAQVIKATLNEIFGRKSAKIKLALTKDGSGKGAAITAAAIIRMKSKEVN